MERFVIISGCSGGGKSSLLAELRRRGYATIDEPGRRIVSEEASGKGHALPWLDSIAFLRRALELSIADWKRATQEPGPVFFDRGLADALSALEYLNEDPALRELGSIHRYGHLVFMTPPWPEIYITDDAGRHSLDDAVEEYERLMRTYPALGYQIAILPRTRVAARAAFVLNTLGLPDGIGRKSDQ